MATTIRTDYSTEEFVLPEKPSLAFLQEKVGGYIEYVYFTDGSALMVDEEGRLKEKAPNDSATILCALKGGPQDLIVGDVVFFSREEMDSMRDDEEEEA